MFIVQTDNCYARNLGKHAELLNFTDDPIANVITEKMNEKAENPIFMDILGYLSF